MRVVVASGKGGTGKTLAATHLAWLAAEQGRETTYADVDVEGPNGHLFLAPVIARRERLAVPVPVLPAGRCDGCGACAAACAFHAILPVPESVLVFPELCHSCGACVRACPTSALAETAHEVGSVREGTAGSVRFLDGVLDVGEPRAVPLIRAVLARIDRRSLAFVDAPPGSACSAAAAVRDADRVVLVTEPTPAGLHDLELAVELCRASGVPCAVLLNRADIADPRPVRDYLRAAGVSILDEWRYDAAVAAACARGALAGRSVPWLRAAVERLLEACLAWPGGAGA